jgi:hypothetical protein
MYEPTLAELVQCADGDTAVARAAACNSLVEKLETFLAPQMDGQTGFAFSPVAGVTGVWFSPVTFDRLRANGGGIDAARILSGVPVNSIVRSAEGYGHVSLKSRIAGWSLEEGRKLRRIWSQVEPDQEFWQEPLFHSFEQSKLPFEGSIRVQFSGSVMSWSPDAGTTVSLGIAVDGEVVHNHQIVRPEPPAVPGELPAVTEARRRGVHVRFDTDHLLELAAPGVITLTNTGGHDEFAVGILRIFPA